MRPSVHRQLCAPFEQPVGERRIAAHGERRDRKRGADVELVEDIHNTIDALAHLPRPAAEASYDLHAAAREIGQSPRFKHEFENVHAVCPSNARRRSGR